MNNQKPHSRLKLSTFVELAPETVRALRAISKGISGGSLEPALIELVKVRASQINGCAFCVNMHWKEARQQGESEQRMQLLSVWHEAPIYTDRERAALAWTEALTSLSEGHVPEEVYEEACQHFSTKELADLSSAIVVINAWNRLGVAYRWVPEVKPEA